MGKRILLLAMVLGVIGGVVAGCNPPAEENKTETPAATAGATGETKTEESK